jgi:hypothetical protein
MYQIVSIFKSSKYGRLWQSPIHRFSSKIAAAPDGIKEPEPYHQIHKDSARLTLRTLLGFPSAKQLKPLDVIPFTIYLLNELSIRLLHRKIEIETMPGNLSRTTSIEAAKTLYQHSINQNAHGFFRHLEPIYSEFLERNENDTLLWSWDFNRDTASLKNYFDRKQIQQEDAADFNSKFAQLIETIKKRHANVVQSIGT